MKKTNKTGIAISSKVKNFNEMLSIIEEFNLNNYFMIYLTSFYRENINEIKKNFLKKNISFEKIIIHSSLFTNIANIIDRNIINNSIKLIKKEFSTMKELGIRRIVIHPGSSLGLSREESIEKLIESLEKIEIFSENIEVSLEIMSKKNSLLNNFEEIKYVFKRVKKIKLVIDICHLYSSGYDIKNNFYSIIKEIEESIGKERISFIHINDSKTPFNSKKDFHERIGDGSIGRESLKKIIKYFHSNGIIQILETPRKLSYIKEYELFLNLLNE